MGWEVLKLMERLTFANDAIGFAFDAIPSPRAAGWEGLARAALLVHPNGHGLVACTSHFGRGRRVDKVAAELGARSYSASLMAGCEIPC
ncbi:hypothetical protein GCM10007874_66700 [Labrys miyagiensis]|uniref:Uncharacterized protein n=1 Tax=Labrys miyagiensis TaxID=346912 RepID=A0ABQ6CU51_9HYPH|nr:hypothetical protein GCM10007874_66700 [Labrys miyagiensis]